MNTQSSPQPFADALRGGSLAFRLRSLLRDTATYGTVDVLCQLLGILLIPIIMRVLLAAEYAVIDAIRIWSLLLLGLVLMGFDQAAARFISQEDHGAARRQIVGQSLAAALLFTGVVCGALYLWAAGVIGFFLESAEPGHVRAFRLMLLAVPALVWITFGKMLLRWNFNRPGYVGVAVGHTGSVLVLSVVFVVLLRRGVVGIFEAQLLGALLAAVVTTVLCARHIAWPRGRRHLRPMLGFGGPLMLVGVLANLVPMLERFLIVRLLGLDLLGLYAVGQRFAGLINVPTGGFNVAWLPFAYTIHREPDAQRTFRRVLDIYCLVFAAGALLFVLAARWALPLFASARYAGALEVVVPLTYAMVIGSVSSITGLGIGLAKRTYLSTIAYALQLAVTAAGIALLAGAHGMVGVAYAFLLGKLALTLFESVASRRVSDVRFGWTIPAMMLLISLGLALVVERFLWPVM